MKKFALLLLLIGVFAPQLLAQSTPKGEVFLGYNYMHNFDQVGGLNLNGWNAAFSFNATRQVGVVAEITGNYANSIKGVLGDVTDKSLYTFLFGPRYYFRSDSRVTPFVHVMGGFSAQQATSKLTGGSSASLTQWQPAMAVGGGLDVIASPRVSIRIAQLDYRATKGFMQKNFRYCAGILFKF